MLTPSLPVDHNSAQHPSYIFPACRLLAIVAAGLNAYLTLRFAQSLWPDERIVSALVALVWEGSLVCFAAVGLKLWRSGAFLKAFFFLGLAGLQMAGSAHASAAFIDQRALAKDQAAISIARDHASALASIASLQAQIARSLVPKNLAALRAEEDRVTALRRAHEADGLMLARGYALLEDPSSATPRDASQTDVHRCIAIMLQLITIASMLVNTNAPPVTKERPKVTPDLYTRARTEIAAGAVGPSNRALQRHFGLGWRGAQAILERMVGEGLLARDARSYQLVS